MKILFAVFCFLFFLGSASAQCTPPTLLTGQHAGMCWPASPTVGITAYNIYRADGACSATPLVWTKLASTAPTVLTYIDLTAAPGVTHCYAFTAVSSAGEGTKSTFLQLTPPSTTPAPPTPPEPPGTPVGTGN